MQNKVDDIKTWLSILGPSLIFIGILKAMLFYYAFAVSITDFIEFSEALLMFFNDIVITVAAISIGIFYLLLSTFIFPSFFKKTISVTKYDNGVEEIIITNKSYASFIYVGAVVAGILLFRIFYYYYNYDFIYSLLIAILGSAFLLFPVLLFLRQKNFIIDNEFVNNRMSRMHQAVQSLAIGFFIVIIIVANLFGVH
jgi:hypothetical protein